MSVCRHGDDACATCAEEAQHGLIRAAMATGDRLDDITRVRIWAKIEHELAAPVRAPQRARGGLVVGAGALAAVAAIAIALVSRGGGDDVLEAPAGAVLTTAIGPHARASLVGPARVEVVGTAADATTIRLKRGAMYAEFEGGAGRSLRILAPGATVDVVGTLFAIEVTDAQTCVSVAHGRVRVTLATGVVSVGGGEVVCTDGDHRVAAIAPATRAVLARQAVALGDPAVDAPAAAAAAVAPAGADTGAGAGAGDALTDAGVALTVDAGAPVDVAAIPAPLAHDGPVVRDEPVRSAPVAARAEVAAIAPVQHPAAPVLAPSPGGGAPAIAPAAGTDAPAAADAPPAPAIAAHDPHLDSAPPPVAAPDTAAALYRVAETALAQRELGAADRALARLVREFPDAPETEQALYERARIAYQRRAWADARARLAQLAKIPSASLAEPGQYLACRVAVMSADADAARCLTAYRAAYPSSPHRAEALALLIQLTHASHGCAGARALIDELVAIAPTSPLSAAWQARCKDAP